MHIKAAQRAQNHAKTIDYQGRQIACWLSVNAHNDDALCVIIQFWEPSIDAPIRLQLEGGDEDITMHIFDDLSETTIGGALDAFEDHIKEMLEGRVAR